MELPFQPITKTMSTQLKEWITPFLTTPCEDKQLKIMNLSIVEQKLHSHFVSMTPLWVTFEYYDCFDKINVQTEYVYVSSTVDLSRNIKLSVVETGDSFRIATEQILAVSANIAV